MSKSGLSVTVDMVSLWRLLICLMVIISFRMILRFIFGLQNDGPSRWENGMMNIQLICFEEEAAKDSGHSEGLTIRQVHKIWCHWVNDRAGYVSDTSAIAGYGANILGMLLQKRSVDYRSPLSKGSYLPAS